jgi:hypothetical protein
MMPMEEKIPAGYSNCSESNENNNGNRKIK